MAKNKILKNIQQNWKIYIIGYILLGLVLSALIIPLYSKTDGTCKIDGYLEKYGSCEQEYTFKDAVTNRFYEDGTIDIIKSMKNVIIAPIQVFFDITNYILNIGA